MEKFVQYISNSTYHLKGNYVCYECLHTAKASEKITSFSGYTKIAPPNFKKLNSDAF